MIWWVVGTAAYVALVLLVAGLCGMNGDDDA